MRTVHRLVLLCVCVCVVCVSVSVLCVCCVCVCVCVCVCWVSRDELERGDGALCNRCLRRGWRSRGASQLQCSLCAEFVPFDAYDRDQLDGNMHDALCPDCVSDSYPDHRPLSSPSSDYADSYDSYDHYDHYDDDDDDDDDSDVDSDDDDRRRCFGCGVLKHHSLYSHRQFSTMGTLARCQDCTLVPFILLFSSLLFSSLLFSFSSLLFSSLLFSSLVLSFSGYLLSLF